MTHPPIICAGRLYGDLIFNGLEAAPAAGREVYCDSLGFHPGGGAFITAAYLANLGHPVDLLATFPAEPFAAPLQAAVKAAGVGTRHCAAAPNGSDPQLTVALVKDEDRAFVTRRTGPALPQPLSLADIAAQHLHIGELATLVEHPDLIDLARGRGMTISLDCGWDETVFSRESAALVGQVDVFLPNEDEDRALAEHGWIKPFSPLDVIKCGARGATVRTATHVETCAAVPVKQVDPTGAGDAFNGGFLSAWLQGKPLKTCLETGNRAGAIAVSQVGGAGGLSAAS